MERLPHASNKAKTNQKNYVGSYRLHSKGDDAKCMSWDGVGCGTYVWTKCKKTSADDDNQVSLSLSLSLHTHTHSSVPLFVHTQSLTVLT